MRANDRIQEVETWLDRLYIAADGASLRVEDRRKAAEVTAILEEIERAVKRFSRRRSLVLVDAAAGKSYVGLLAAQLVFGPLGLDARVLVLEKNQRLVALSRTAAELLETRTPVECLAADVSDPSCWPEEPDIVVALHACGPASDVIIERAIACRARLLLLVPCCTSDAVAAVRLAKEEAVRLAIPDQAPVRRRFIQAMVDAERTRRLEAAGYVTEVVEFVGATVTPHNLLWRARRGK
ncbi:MAG: methyltransferase [Acidobacteria bacterium]|nr:MAG: methyltransferase [Acidobacteriota bacterium]